jgi:hypothetical protein
LLKINECDFWLLGWGGVEMYQGEPSSKEQRAGIKETAVSLAIRLADLIAGCGVPVSMQRLQQDGRPY